MVNFSDVSEVGMNNLSQWSDLSNDLSDSSSVDDDLSSDWSSLWSWSGFDNSGEMGNLLSDNSDSLNQRSDLSDSLSDDSSVVSDLLLNWGWVDTSQSESLDQSNSISDGGESLVIVTSFEFS